MSEQTQIEQQAVLQNFAAKSKDFTKQIVGVNIDQLFQIAQLETLVSALQERIKVLEEEKSARAAHALVED